MHPVTTISDISCNMVFGNQVIHADTATLRIYRAENLAHPNATGRLQHCRLLGIGGGCGGVGSSRRKRSNSHRRKCETTERICCSLMRKLSKLQEKKKVLQRSSIRPLPFAPAPEVSRSNSQAHGSAATREIPPTAGICRTDRFQQVNKRRSARN